MRKKGRERSERERRGGEGERKTKIIVGRVMRGGVYAARKGCKISGGGADQSMGTAVGVGAVGVVQRRE